MALFLLSTYLAIFLGRDLSLPKLRKLIRDSLICHAVQSPQMIPQTEYEACSDALSCFRSREWAACVCVRLLWVQDSLSLVILRERRVSCRSMLMGLDYILFACH